FTAGGLVLLPFAALSGGLAVPATPLGWWWLAFLALVPTALAYALYFTGLPAAGATPAALAALLEPLAAALLAIAVLDERLALWGWLGAALLVLAVVLARPSTGRSPTMVLGPCAARGRNHASALAEDKPWEYCVPAILDSVRRIGEGRVLRKLEAVARQVYALESSFEARS